MKIQVYRLMTLSLLLGTLIVLAYIRPTASPAELGTMMALILIGASKVMKS